MTVTTDLDFLIIQENQNSKEVVVNDNMVLLDKNLAATLDVDATAGGTISVTRLQFQENARLRLIGTPAAAFIVETTSIKGYIIISNTSGQAATIRSTATPGTTVAIANGEDKLVYNTGSAGNNMVNLSGSASSSGASFIPAAADFPTAKGNATGIAITDLTGGVRLVKDAGTSRTRGAAVRAVSGNFSSIGKIIFPQQTNNNYRFAGIIVLDTTTDEHYMIALQLIGTTIASVGLVVAHASSFTVVETADITKNIVGLHEAYFKVQDDGTNLIFSWSPDNVIFQVLLTVGRTVNLTNGPGFVGLLGYSVSTSADVIELLCSYWKQI